MGVVAVEGAGLRGFLVEGGGGSWVESRFRFVG